MTGNRFLWAVLIALGIGCALLIARLALRDPHMLLDAERGAPFVHNVVLLVVLAASAVLFWRLRPGRILKHLAAWTAVCATLVLGYSYRHEAAALADRMMAELVPSRGLAVDGTVAFRERSNGHFAIDADVNGVPVRFLVDTGATDVTLTRRDAERLGFDTGRLTYDRIYRTANGLVKGAAVRLRRIVIGPISMTDVRASVSRGDLAVSLLGMSYLSLLSGFEVTKGTLILRP